MSTLVEQLLMHKGRHVWSVEPNATIAEAVAVLGEHQIGAVLVCDRGRLVGVLSERDCVREVLWERRHTHDTQVRELMRSGVSVVAPDDTIQHCMGLMNDRRVRHLPVIHDDEVVGLISIGDVINALLREQESLIESLESYITGSPAAITAAQ